ncbi:L,D-transpeptidase [Sphingomonas aerolata]|uniref:L,D-transpeptidase n=1 Tax=Sphingomonas aerolata TaxID=185951 RepID=UPI00208EE2DC|nr:L,D-transpeptidase [Sphingomonas aerolata]USQ99345.1 L,D-transpeptidase [Sphingomonas aerolata]
MAGFGSRAARHGVLVAVALAAGVASAAGARPVAASTPATARFGTAAVSSDARDTVDWVMRSRDNQALPFVVIDKVNAVVFAFDGAGVLRDTAPALLGLARGDDSVPGIGQRKLATITPAERTTPAGRFQASIGADFEQDILWIDYAAALSLHRVIAGRRVDDRAGRLASATPQDNRISYGCVNVPARFYDGVIKPLFTGTVGIVYILPETRPLRSVFAMTASAPDTVPH